MTSPQWRRPQWLASYQAYMRDHPVRRAAFWSLGCFVLLSVLHVVHGERITASRALIELASWCLAGVPFYLLMRLWEANRAR